MSLKTKKQISVFVNNLAAWLTSSLKIKPLKKSKWTLIKMQSLSILGSTAATEQMISKPFLQDF